MFSVYGVWVMVYGVCFMFMLYALGSRSGCYLQCPWLFESVYTATVNGYMPHNKTLVTTPQGHVKYSSGFEVYGSCFDSGVRSIGAFKYVH
ncbi:hypothetical protein T484DRAFT_2688841 [Baffinella frigidus]|nr:hypothetical protein T484DRAFT_2688841 [Cryptophyta sp. CCMP2293]